MTRVRWPSPARRWRIARSTSVAFLAALVAAGCGDEDDFIPAPDCGGTNLIAFASDRGGRSQIFLYDTQLGGYRALPGLDDAASADLDPAITRDARYIAFGSVRGSTGSDLFVYDRCAATIAPQPDLNSPGDERDPAFTGDGQKLAFARDTLGDLRIRLFEGPSDRLIPLPGLDATAGFDDWAPAPDQAGNLIAFVSNRNGNDDVYVYDAPNDSVLALPDILSPAEDTDPWLTPDGRWLAFASSRAGGAGMLDLYLYDLQSRSYVTLDPDLNTALDERAPTISFDSNVVVFSSNRTGTLGGMDLWLHLRTTPGDIIRYASGSADDASPSLVWR